VDVPAAGWLFHVNSAFGPGIRRDTERADRNRHAVRQIAHVDAKRGLRDRALADAELQEDAPMIFGTRAVAVLDLEVGGRAEVR
jgi:hypothetical protein